MKKIWTLLAASVGFTFGLLLAKKSGKELRKQLHKSKSGKNAAETLGKAYIDAAEEAMEETKNLMESKQIKKMIKTGKKQLEEAGKQTKEKGEELLGEAKKKALEVKKKYMK